MKVLIIGGGIAGTAVGVALARAGISARIVEGRPERQAAGGAFLALAPNGINALATLGLGDLVHRAAGIPVPEIRFYNSHGHQAGHLDARDAEQVYGASTYLVKRGVLEQELLAATRSADVAVTTGTRLVELQQGDNDVTAILDDGSAITADLLLGCDGVHSVVRKLALPSGPRARYTGVLDCGAWTAIDTLPDTHGQRMVWGQQAFFGYAAHQGTTYWFSKIAEDVEPSPGELDTLDGSSVLAQLRELHAADPAPVPQILAAAESVIGAWPIYDLPDLPTWHHHRICLLGNAADAASPSAGQGASLALEDAAVLAKCLRDLDTPQSAFTRFEQLRKPRADAIVAMGRRIGDRKIPSPGPGLDPRPAPTAVPADGRTTSTPAVRLPHRLGSPGRLRPVERHELPRKEPQPHGNPRRRTGQQPRLRTGRHDPRRGHRSGRRGTGGQAEDRPSRHDRAAGPRATTAFLRGTQQVGG
jgi:2-polyprenyl-6-methoxyphenol hydroxylase-like FAD-dependent oxidoreductase